MKTDAELRHDVEQELESDPTFDAHKIGDAVDHGIVTLTGEIGAYADKQRAADAAERVDGVRGVANELSVRLQHEHDDTDIAKAAVNTLEWNTSLPNDRVVVKVADGWVTLTGEVTHAHQRKAAEESVRHLRGVKGIANLIAVAPQPEAAELKRRIEESFEHEALLDAQHIAISIDNGNVTLQGTVRSWAERSQAEQTAWAEPGVTSVVNEITVSATWPAVS